MKLNPNCVRDILLAVENNDFGVPMKLGTLYDKLPKYSEEDIQYSCIKLHEGGYLNLHSVNIQSQSVPLVLVIYDLTFQGHEFLENVKSDTTWNKTKDIAKTVGSFSINTLKEISVSVLSDVIKSKL